MGVAFLHVLKILGQGNSGQITSSEQDEMSGSNFTYLYAPVSLTVSDRFLSNFQDVLSSPSFITYLRFLCC